MIADSGRNLSAYERNCLFLNLKGTSFLDGSFASGVDIDSDSRSVIVGDFNHDNAPDLLVGSVGGGPLRLFLNRFPKKKWVRIELVGSKSNRQAIGSRVTIECNGRKIVRDMFPENGFMGQGPAEMIVGLGDARKIDTITVRWPTGFIQRFDDLPIDSRIRIREGEKSPRIAK